MARSSGAGGGGEYIHHITGIRMRLNGTGSLQMSLSGLDDIRTYTMKPLEMSLLPGLEPTRLSNFRSQRTRFNITTTEINEYFRISRIVIFAKTSALAYPM